MNRDHAEFPVPSIVYRSDGSHTVLYPGGRTVHVDAQHEVIYPMSHSTREMMQALSGLRAQLANATSPVRRAALQAHIEYYERLLELPHHAEEAANLDQASAARDNPGSGWVWLGITGLVLLVATGAARWAGWL